MPFGQTTTSMRMSAVNATLGQRAGDISASVQLCVSECGLLHPNSDSPHKNAMIKISGTIVAFGNQTSVYDDPAEACPAGRYEDGAVLLPTSNAPPGAPPVTPLRPGQFIEVEYKEFNKENPVTLSIHKRGEMLALDVSAEYATYFRDSYARRKAEEDEYAPVIDEETGEETGEQQLVLEKGKWTDRLDENGNRILLGRKGDWKRKGEAYVVTYTSRRCKPINKVFRDADIVVQHLATIVPTKFPQPYETYTYNGVTKFRQALEVFESGTGLQEVVGADGIEAVSFFVGASVKKDGLRVEFKDSNDNVEVANKVPVTLVRAYYERRADGAVAKNLIAYVCNSHLGWLVIDADLWARFGEQIICGYEGVFSLKHPVDRLRDAANAAVRDLESVDVALPAELTDAQREFIAQAGDGPFHPRAIGARFAGVPNRPVIFTNIGCELTEEQFERIRGGITHRENPDLSVKKGDSVIILNSADEDTFQDEPSMSKFVYVAVFEDGTRATGAELDALLDARGSNFSDILLVAVRKTHLGLPGKRVGSGDAPPAKRRKRKA